MNSTVDDDERKHKREYFSFYCLLDADRGPKAGKLFLKQLCKAYMQKTNV